MPKAAVEGPCRARLHCPKTSAWGRSFCWLWMRHFRSIFEPEVVASKFAEDRNLTQDDATLDQAVPLDVGLGVPTLPGSRETSLSRSSGPNPGVGSWFRATPSSPRTRCSVSTCLTCTKRRSRPSGRRNGLASWVRRIASTRTFWRPWRRGGRCRWGRRERRSSSFDAFSRSQPTSSCSADPASEWWCSPCRSGTNIVKLFWLSPTVWPDWGRFRNFGKI